MASAFVIGLGVAGVAVGVRVILHVGQQNAHILRNMKMPTLPFSAMGGSGYLRGGFEAQMTRREAAQVLGLRDISSRDKIKEAHRRIMLLNHPDRGGSPFLASKINEAKDMMEKANRR